MPVAVELRPFVLKFQLEANGCQEWFEVVEQVLLGDSAVKVKEVKHLPFHQINFGQGKAKPLVPLDSRVPSPMFVLGRRVIEILRSQDKSSKEDAVSSTPHALGNRRQASLETGEEDQ
jgi:hypothetical protein